MTPDEIRAAARQITLNAISNVAASADLWEQAESYGAKGATVADVDAVEAEIRAIRDALAEQWREANDDCCWEADRA